MVFGVVFMFADNLWAPYGRSVVLKPPLWCVLSYMIPRYGSRNGCRMCCSRAGLPSPFAVHAFRVRGRELPNLRSACKAAGVVLLSRFYVLDPACVCLRFSFPRWVIWTKGDSHLTYQVVIYVHTRSIDYGTNVNC